MSPPKRVLWLLIRTYPGLDKLNPDTQGAIVSLIYNRGNKLTGDSRTEMAELVPLIQNADYSGIADAIERMKRVWIGKEGMAGLIERREVEAKIVTDSLTSADQMTGAHIYNV